MTGSSPIRLQITLPTFCFLVCVAAQLPLKKERSIKTHRILIADDHPVVRRGLRSLVEGRSDWQIVAEASNGKEAVALTMQFRPDVAILDVNMPELNGIEASRLIAQAVPETRILMIGSHQAEALAARTMGSRAHGYILKSAAERDLLPALDAVLHDRTFLSREKAKPAREKSSQKTPGEVDSPLSPREMEVLQLLAEGKSNKQVAATLGISARTAENHRARIMAKLGLRSLSELIRYAIRNKIIDA